MERWDSKSLESEGLSCVVLEVTGRAISKSSFSGCAFADFPQSVRELLLVRKLLSVSSESNREYRQLLVNRFIFISKDREISHSL